MDTIWYMNEHQVHFGKKFYKDKKAGYWLSIDSPKIRAHRWVWINIHGKIPKGYHIHHKNDDKSDNRIENLELIEASRHLSFHMQDPERKKIQARICDSIRHLTKKWHGSKEGLAWHKHHALKFGFGKYEGEESKCKFCSVVFKTKSPKNMFCTNNCKSAWRRRERLDFVDKECPVCKKTFSSNKYLKTKTCSLLCGNKIKDK